MSQFACLTALVLSGLVAVFGMGCGTKSTAPAEVVDSKKLPGANEVTAALEKKDYDGAMAAWMKLRESIATEDQQAQFATLTRLMQTKLFEAAANDPKAAAASDVLRRTTLGR